MKTLNDDGRQKIDAIADRYNLKSETVESLLTSIIQGNGTMAQFNLPELGGQGQWMKGGMTMVGDMFNNRLRSTVDRLCTELSELITTTVLYETRDVEGIASQNANGRESANFSNQSDHGWPPIFGKPTASGSQNNLRYAYFAPARRLVIEDGGKRTIYDTKHHHITGVSQQQGLTNSYRFTSQDGTVDLSSLQMVSDLEHPRQPTPEIAYDVTSNADLSEQNKSPEDIVLSTIEKLNKVFERGQITEAEFTSKKKELLDRL